MISIQNQGFTFFPMITFVMNLLFLNAFFAMLTTLYVIPLIVIVVGIFAFVDFLFTGLTIITVINEIF